MRRFRVGTLSMGVVLVVTGVILLLARLNNKTVLDLVLKWWPLVLILLGGEVLWYVYSAKDDNPKVKYDIFSIIIIFLLVISGLGIQALTEIGVVPRLSKMVSAQQYLLKKPYQEVSLDENIKKIVVESPGCQLNVYAGDGNAIIATATARVTADSEETAEQLITKEGIVSRKAGDTLYLSFNLPLSGGELSYQARITEISLVIPGNRKLEISSDYPLKLHADNLKNNWLLEAGNTEVTLPGNADLKIEALVEHSDELNGNVAWKITEPAEENDDPRQVRGELVLGNGQYKLSIVSRNNVVVNKID